jgi:hypothetical protein
VNPVIANADGFVIVDVRMRASPAAGRDVAAKLQLRSTEETPA